MSSLIEFSGDDKDFDDAALWAVIDSAEASRSTSVKSRKPLAIKYPNFSSPPTPISHPSPPPKLPQNHKRQYSPSSNPRNNTSWQRSQKIARSSGSEVVTESSSPLVIVRNLQRTPESHLSPEIRKYGVKEFSSSPEVSPSSCVQSEEKNVMMHSLSGKFPSVSLFKEYQNAAMAILEKSDYTMISGCPFIKKSGWRKISFYFNVSYEIKDKNIEFDENRNVQRAEFVVRAYMQGGRFSDGWGSCERREKRFSKPNHEIPSIAETRAKNKACQDLLGIGEYRPGASQYSR
ncbi:uncharacterized protein LOC119989757 [Tripterygium wilfordii]|uniref:uncharacterized protein LOC119989757 n=1 Tax=Tripterygium wilfordii TaxID=458696 RepID=UPI0018F7FE7B|nr:uncharacterized protein LOC119989757 [Tripterygium wilfordii]